MSINKIAIVLVSLSLVACGGRVQSDASDSSVAGDPDSALAGSAGENGVAGEVSQGGSEDPASEEGGSAGLLVETAGSPSLGGADEAGSAGALVVAGAPSEEGGASEIAGSPSAAGSIQDIGVGGAPVVAGAPSEGGASEIAGSSSLGGAEEAGTAGTLVVAGAPSEGGASEIAGSPSVAGSGNTAESLPESEGGSGSIAGTLNVGGEATGSAGASPCPNCPHPIMDPCYGLGSFVYQKDDGTYGQYLGDKTDLPIVLSADSPTGSVERGLQKVISVTATAECGDVTLSHIFFRTGADIVESDWEGLAETNTDILYEMDGVPTFFGFGPGMLSVPEKLSDGGWEWDCRFPSPIEIKEGESFTFSLRIQFGELIKPQNPFSFVLEARRLWNAAGSDRQREYDMIQGGSILEVQGNELTYVPRANLIIYPLNSLESRTISSSEDAMEVVSEFSISNYGDASGNIDRVTIWNDLDTGSLKDCSRVGVKIGGQECGNADTEGTDNDRVTINIDPACETEIVPMDSTVQGANTRTMRILCQPAIPVPSSEATDDDPVSGDIFALQAIAETGDGSYMALNTEVPPMTLQ